MAGRKRTMMNRVDRYEVMAFGLANEIFRSIPVPYRLGTTAASDTVAQAWQDALKAATRTWSMISDLGLALRERAGLPEEGPTDHCRLGQSSPSPRSFGPSGHDLAVEDAVEPRDGGSEVTLPGSAPAEDSPRASVHVRAREQS